MEDDMCESTNKETKLVEEEGEKIIYYDNIANELIDNFAKSKQNYVFLYWE